MQAETNKPLKGIHYLMDSDNNKIAVQIDLNMYGELWQEFLDRLLIEFRKDEDSDSFDDFLKELKEEGLIDE
ncbi:MAG: hypothetical protein J5I94_11590 [Phaeodactylibacter sp.]|nr:hypothetical protein [Phaeodactylibacter sp.]